MKAEKGLSLKEYCETQGVPNKGLSIFFLGLLTSDYREENQNEISKHPKISWLDGKYVWISFNICKALKTNLSGYEITS